MPSVTGRNSLTSAANSKLLTSATNEIAHPNLAVIVTSPLEHDTQRLRGTEKNFFVSVPQCLGGSESTSTSEVRVGSFGVGNCGSRVDPQTSYHRLTDRYSPHHPQLLPLNCPASRGQDLCPGRMGALQLDRKSVG